MSEIISKLESISEYLQINNDLNLSLFLVIYFVSFIPFYLGYFLIIYGTTRNLKWRDIFHLELRGKLQWSEQSKVGLIIHLIGRLMPYAYIIIYARNLHWAIYVFVWGVILISLYVLFKKIYFHSKRSSFDPDVSIDVKEVITDTGDREILWNIYDKTFAPVNKISPCKQSIDYDHFIEIMHDRTVRKYILRRKDVGIIGLALVTNDFKNTPWISEEYFKVNYPAEYSLKNIYYFMGIAISQYHRGRKYSILLIEKIIDDLPEKIVLGFDHSRNINPMLHHFTRIVRQADVIERKHIDRQHYHVVQRKS